MILKAQNKGVGSQVRKNKFWVELKSTNQTKAIYTHAHFRATYYNSSEK